MLNKKILFTVILIEIIILVTSTCMGVDLNNPFERIIIVSLLLIPFLFVLCVVGFDSSISTPKRVLAILFFVLFIVVFIASCATVLLSEYLKG